MLNPEIIEGWVSRLEDLKEPFALYRIQASGKGRCLIVTGPSSLDCAETAEQEYVLQPSCNVRDMSVEVFLFEEVSQWLFARKMVAVDKVGWKTAVSLLYKTPWKDMRPHVGNATVMARFPGFSGKTGKSILGHVCEAPPEPVQVLDEDAVGALRTMGYKATDAKNRIREVLKEHPDYSTEQLIAAALQR